MGLDSGGMPTSLMISGPKWSDALVLRLAHAFQQATTCLGGRGLFVPYAVCSVWHTQHPAAPVAAPLRPANDETWGEGEVPVL